jgi:hypothetical protein
MKGSTSEQTVELTDALLRENAEMLQNRAASPLDEVKVESTGRNILWEVDVRGAPSMLRLVARKFDIQYSDKRLGIFQRLHNARKSSKAQVLDSPA